MSSLFGNPTQNKGIFSNINTTSSQSGASGSVFGSVQPQQANGLLGTPGMTPQAPSSSVFGGAMAAKPAGSIFGGSTLTANSQQQPSLYNATIATTNPQQSSLFGGASANRNPQTAQAPALSNLYTRSGGLFGESTNQSVQGTASLFGLPGAASQNTQVQPQQSESLFGKLQTSRIWTENEPIPAQKNVEHQIKTVWRKWNPNNHDSPFQAYLYNNVGADAAPFYRPGADEDEQRWEDALAKAPSQGCIPVPVRGFQELGRRIVNQTQYFNILQCRLHEINNGLSELLRRHDLEISARAAECRRRHVRLSQKCLNLATRTQILRNRGYALDSAEEELAQKLRKLEKQVLDPALSGREEEIWARMVSLRERGRILQVEFDKGGSASKEEDGVIDNEILKRAKKILEDYDSQLSHLTKELQNITTDYEDWAKGRLA